jgi:undecaprenyl-diphosphatase
VTWWQAAILGLVEGITEYLPISSTGHLILASALMGLDDTPAKKSAVDAFNIVIQGGAILAVLGLYRQRVLQMILGVLGRNPAGRKLAIHIIIAFLPAAILGPLLNDKIEELLFRPGPVIAALTLGGVFMIWLDRWRLRHMREDEKRHQETGDTSHIEGRLELEDLTPLKALFIGLLQTVAMWPGTSRSMMTIVGGVLVGLRPSRAAEFSFLLGLPTLGGACAYTLFKDLTRDEGDSLFEVLGWQSAVIGLLFATVSAALAVKWLVSYLNKHGLALFGYYRIVLSLVLIAMIGAGLVRISTATGIAHDADDVQATETP